MAVVEFFVLGCTGIVMFFHGVNFIFHALAHQISIRSLRFFTLVGTCTYVVYILILRETKKSSVESYSVGDPISENANPVVNRYERAEINPERTMKLDKLPKTD